MYSSDDLSNYISLMAEDRGLKYWCDVYHIVIYGNDNNKAIEVDFLMADHDQKFLLYYFKDFNIDDGGAGDISMAEEFDLREPNSINVIDSWIDMIA